MEKWFIWTWRFVPRMTIEMQDHAKPWAWSVLGHLHMNAWLIWDIGHSDVYPALLEILRVTGWIDLILAWSWWAVKSAAQWRPHAALCTMASLTKDRQLTKRLWKRLGKCVVSIMPSSLCTRDSIKSRGIGYLEYPCLGVLRSVNCNTIWHYDCRDLNAYGLLDRYGGQQIHLRMAVIAGLRQVQFT